MESLRDHHLRFDYIQCTICHEEFKSEYDLEDHEDIHRDTRGNYTCEWCEEKIPLKNYARLHSYCHNPPEILEEIKNYEINLFQQMMDVSPDIISKIMKNTKAERQTAAAAKKAEKVERHCLEKTKCVEKGRATLSGKTKCVRKP